ncbi:MAG: DegT/DnrJ/EryC1/StrS family aminotransferase [Gemmatimonadetes bacterium]|nr:DegT/DnrJ/EryC1/StrS family aminotransferase [Gemmatimonadota bacterium]
MHLRHQLPVHSPIPLAAALRGAGGMLRLRGDPRPAVADLLAREYAAEEVVLCGSGTQALQLALEAGMRAAGGQPVVALPGYSCFDVASAAVGAGAAITLYDLDPETLGPDLDSLEAALARGARVVVVSPLYGVPVDWEALEERASRVGALLIEDAAQGHGASWRGRPLGSLGRLSVLSFGRGKGWTGGKGGALLLRGESLSAGSGARTLGEPALRGEASTLAGVLAQWLLGRPAVYGLPASLPWLGLGQTLYREPSAPRRMGKGAAAMLERTREASVRAAASRRANARLLLEELPAGAACIRVDPEADPGYLRLPVRLRDGMAAFPEPADALRLGVAPGYPSTLAALPAVRARMADGGARLEGAETLVRELVTLPTHPLLTSRERSELLRVLDSCAAPAARRAPQRDPKVGTGIAL